jgi:ABC-type transport system involved in multi-copper enzyme maturation permease subunit
MSRVSVNPVLGRELRERMRTGRSLTVVTVYVLLLGFALWAVYSSEREQRVDPFGSLLATEAATVGRLVFEWVLLIMFVLVLFLVPALTSGAISGERERQTLVPLQLTLLRPRSIVLGKLGASLAFLCLLLVASAPIVSVAYLIGGMTFTQVLAALVTMLFCGLVFAAVTMLCSALFQRTQQATVMAYAVVLLLTVGTYIGWGVWTAIRENDSGNFDDDAPTWVLAVNPVVLLADVVGTETEDSETPLGGMRDALYPEESVDVVDMEGGFIGPGFAVEGEVIMVPGPDGEPMAVDAFSGEPVDEPDALREDDGSFWKQSLIALSTLAIVSLAIATRRVRTPREVER